MEEKVKRKGEPEGNANDQARKGEKKNGGRHIGKGRGRLELLGEKKRHN